jgi:hypothetical protein
LFWVHDLQNYRLPLEKIAYWPPLPPLWPLCAMQQVNPRNFIAAKAIFESVLPWRNVYLDCAILCLLAHR